MEEAPKWPKRTHACSVRKVISITCLVFFTVMIGKLYVSAICEERLRDFTTLGSQSSSGDLPKHRILWPDCCSFWTRYKTENGVAQTPPFVGAQKSTDVKPNATDKPISLPRQYGWTNEIPSSSTAAPPLRLTGMHYLGKNNFKQTFFARGIFKESSIFKSGPDTTKLSFEEKVALWKRSLPYQPQDVNLLSLDAPSFLENYKNPCWEETFTSTYNNSYYTTRADVRSQLNTMTQILHDRRHGHDFHRIRCLPYFLMIGQPKCGSTDLYRKLVTHPDVSSLPPSLKEPHWWTRTRLGRLNSRGQPVSFDGYTDIYDYAAYLIEQETVEGEPGDRFHQKITGEASMSTFWDNDHWWAMVGNENSTEPRVLTQHYIRHLLPGVRLVLILRNPTDRMYSDFLYFRKDRKSPADFHTAVTRAVRLYEECMSVRSLRACVYDSFLKLHAQIRLRLGLYSVFLADWLAVFPRHQFLVIRTEEYGRNTTSVLRQLYTFLGLRKLTLDEENEIVSMKKANTRRKSDLQYGDMLPETRRLLDSFYQPFNRQLAGMLNDESYLWNDVT